MNSAICLTTHNLNKKITIMKSKRNRTETKYSNSILYPLKQGNKFIHIPSLKSINYSHLINYFS